MKKLFLALALAAMAAGAAFAEVGVGGAAFVKSPALVGQSADINNLNVNQVSFGADARFKLGWFQAEGLLLYSAGPVDSLDLYLDAGVSLGLSIFNFSFGAGPNFTNNFGQSSPVQAGLNAKIGVDVRVAAFSVGMSYIMAMNLDNGVYIRTATGLLGLQVLYWL